mgnify:CR=1 FL=1
MSLEEGKIGNILLHLGPDLLIIGVKEGNDIVLLDIILVGISQCLFEVPVSKLLFQLLAVLGH